MAGTGWRNGLRQGEDGLWHFRFVFRGQRYEGNTGCPIYRDAITWLAAYRGRVAKGEVGIQAVPTVALAYESLIQEMETRTSSAHVARAKTALGLHVLPHIGHKPADTVTKGDIEEVLKIYLEGDSRKIMEKDLHRKHTKHGANTLIIYIKMVFNHLISHKLLDALPFKIEKLGVAQKRRSFVPIELESKFFEAIDKARNLDVMLAVRAMFWLGLREIEALEMRWEGLAWDLSAYVPGSTVHDQTKGGEAASLPTEQSLRVLLWSIIWRDYNGVKPLGGWVIPAEDGKPRRSQFTKKTIQRAAVAIRIPGLTPHRMRASLATNLARAGYQAHHIQKALRHKQLQTSESYVMLGQSDLLAGMEALVKKAKGG